MSATRSAPPSRRSADRGHTGRNPLVGRTAVLFSPRDQIEVEPPQTSHRPLKLARNVGPTDGIRWRLMLLGMIFVVVAGALVWRLVSVQVLNPEQYVDYGLDQRIRRVELAASRGDILDRNGDQLATSLPRTTFFTDPTFVDDAEAAARLMAPILGVSEETLLASLRADNSFAYLARQVDEDTAEAIKALEIPGVFHQEEPARFNPAGDLLARALVGRVGIDNQGLSGLEFAFDEVLRGVPGEMIFERDQAGNTIPNGLREVVAASPGSDVVTTIDRTMQFEVERLLKDQVELMGAKGGVALVTRPQTGEILAMVTVSRDEDGNAQVSVENRAITWAFEPGSVMKAVTFAGVLDSGIATPESSISVDTSIQIFDQEFSEHEDLGIRDLTVREILVESSNVGTVQWAQAMGADSFDRALRNMGFGSAPGLGLPGETAGIMLDREDWDGTTLAASALGQGIAVSPAQMLAAYNVIANDGRHVPLRVVEETIAPDGARAIARNSPGSQVMSQDAAAELRSMLTDVVTQGTGAAASVDGYVVAGKTGTARKPLAQGGYEDGAGNFRYVSSFVGFLPADRPEISILVAIDEPSASIYASAAAAPTFSDIARFALRHFQIPPSPEVTAEVTTGGSVFIPNAPATGGG